MTKREEILHAIYIARCLYNKNWSIVITDYEELTWSASIFPRNAALPGIRLSCWGPDQAAFVLDCDPEDVEDVLEEQGPSTEDLDNLNFEIWKLWEARS